MGKEAQSREVLVSKVGYILFANAYETVDSLLRSLETIINCPSQASFQ